MGRESEVLIRFQEVIVERLVSPKDGFEKGAFSRLSRPKQKEAVAKGRFKVIL
jgi:hypothetical protein